MDVRCLDKAVGVGTCMSLIPQHPPTELTERVAGHLQLIGHPTSSSPLLREAEVAQLELVAPHRAFVLHANSVFNQSLADAVFAGWRYLVTEGDRVLMTAETVRGAAVPPSLNAGPFVASMASAIDTLEGLPAVKAGDFELRVLTVPALYAVAAWLVGSDAFLVPLAPAPPYLSAGRSYTEREFVQALRDPAQQALARD
jgi:hypothetical protein